MVVSFWQVFDRCHRNVKSDVFTDFYKLTLKLTKIIKNFLFLVKENLIRDSQILILFPKYFFFF